MPTPSFALEVQRGSIPGPPNATESSDGFIFRCVCPRNRPASAAPYRPNPRPWHSALVSLNHATTLSSRAPGAIDHVGRFLPSEGTRRLYYFRTRQGALNCCAADGASTISRPGRPTSGARGRRSPRPLSVRRPGIAKGHFCPHGRTLQPTPRRWRNGEHACSEESGNEQVEDARARQHIAQPSLFRTGAAAGTPGEVQLAYAVTSTLLRWCTNPNWPRFLVGADIKPVARSARYHAVIGDGGLCTGGNEGPCQRAGGWSQGDFHVVGIGEGVFGRIKHHRIVHFVWQGQIGITRINGKAQRRFAKDIGSRLGREVKTAGYGRNGCESVSVVSVGHRQF